MSKTPATRATPVKAAKTAKPSPTTKTKPTASAVAKKPAPKPIVSQQDKSVIIPRTPVKAPQKTAAKPSAPAAPTKVVAARPAPAPAPKSAPPPAVTKAVAATVAAAAAGAAAVKKNASARKAAQPPAIPAPVKLPVRDLPPAAPSRQINVNIVEDIKSLRKVDPKLANVWKSKAGRELSEDELLAMPDGEYMNEKQLEYFRHLLMLQRDDLLSNAGETTEHLREDTSIVPDPADRATIEEEHALELRTRDRERKLLKKISQSIARIDAGEYGFCDETGEPIGLGRLLARPTATLSLEAQQRREMKQKMFGD